MGAAAFLIVCQRSATRALARHALQQVKRRPLAARDPLPDPSWKVKEVVEASGAVLAIVDIARRAKGAVYDTRDKEFLFLDDSTAAKRAERLLAAADAPALAAWIRCCAPDPYEHGDPRWSMLGAICAVVEPALATLDARRAFVIANALRGVRADPTQLEDTCLALATQLASDADVQDAAHRIRERRQIAADAAAPPPRDVTEVQALFAGVAAHDASAQRRLQKFLRYDHAALARAVLAAIEAGYDPSVATIACVLEALPMARLAADDRERMRMVTQPTALAHAMRDAAAAYADATGVRAAAYSQARFDAYEKYRLDPLVAKPRSRGDDVAMFRDLNDALYGRARDRPQLPLQVVALVCDRRFDEARAAYVAELGEANADAAIADAIAHFAPDRDY